MVGQARPSIKLSVDGQLDVQDGDQQRSVVLVGWKGNPWMTPVEGHLAGQHGQAKKRCLGQGTFLHINGSSGEICPGLSCGMRLWIQQKWQIIGNSCRWMLMEVENTAENPSQSLHQSRQICQATLMMKVWPGT